MLDVEVIENPIAATVALEPVRCQLLSELAEPASAATLAARIGLTRQKVNYHLRALEKHGLVEEAEQRKWGGLTERLLVAKAASYVVSPAVLGPVASDPGKSADRLSASFMIALAARTIRELGGLLQRARAVGKRLPSLSVDTEISFRSPAERAAFTQELAQAVAGLAAKYHDADAPAARPHRLVVMAYPAPPDREERAQKSP